MLHVLFIQGLIYKFLLFYGLLVLLFLVTLAASLYFPFYFCVCTIPLIHCITIDIYAHVTIVQVNISICLCMVHIVWNNCFQILFYIYTLFLILFPLLYSLYLPSWILVLSLCGIILLFVTPYVPIIEIYGIVVDFHSLTLCANLYWVIIIDINSSD